MVSLLDINLDFQIRFFLFYMYMEICSKFVLYVIFFVIFFCFCRCFCKYVKVIRYIQNLNEIYMYLEKIWDRIRYIIFMYIYVILVFDIKE